MGVLIDVFLPLGLAFIMFSLGLGLTIGDFARVARRPKAFGLGAINQVVLLPLVTLGIILAFGIKAEMAVGFMILSACPGGVTSNIISKVARGDVALSVSLTAVISLVSALTVPLILAWSMQNFMGGGAVEINIFGIAAKMFALTVLPITLGLALRHFLPARIEAIEPATGRLASILFAIIVIAALAANWSLFADNIAVIGPALVLLNLLLLALGLFLPQLLGLSLHEAKTISIETGIQNSTLGIAVAALLVPVADGFSAYALPAAVYGIMMYLVTLPIVAWYRRMGR